jgi:hypothetical protein
MTERLLRRQIFLLTLILIVLIANLIIDLSPYIAKVVLLRSLFKSISGNNNSDSMFRIYQATADPAKSGPFFSIP